MEELINLSPINAIEKNQLYFAILDIIKLDLAPKEKAMQIFLYFKELMDEKSNSDVETMPGHKPAKKSPIFRRVG